MDVFLKINLPFTKDISVGDNHSFAITDEGLYGWGDNE